MAAKKKSSGYRIEQDIKAAHVSGDDLALIFGVTKSQVHRLTREDGLPKAKPGWFNLCESVQFYCQKIRDAKKGGHVVNEQRERLYKEQERKLKIDNAERLGELLPAEEVATMVNSIAATFTQQLDGLAPRVSGIVANLDDPAEIQRIIFDECRQIRVTAAAAVEDITNNYDS